MASFLSLYTVACSPNLDRVGLNMTSRVSGTKTSIPLRQWCILHIPPISAKFTIFAFIYLFASLYFDHDAFMLYTYWTHLRWHSFSHCRHLYSASSSGATQKRSQPQRGRIMLHTFSQPPKIIKTTFPEYYRIDNSAVLWVCALRRTVLLKCCMILCDWSSVNCRLWLNE